ncbi:MAG TPA: HlyD family efflux transporter periplasmic adaptor subunit [Bryobacteraceae bacterium]|nr:HlyD family efflux transporter periplasmic adaptor subunit [Bryobacteraceae bacterium]
MKRFAVPIAGVVLCILIAGGVIWSYLGHKSDIEADAKSDEPIKNASMVKSANGETVVTFDDETQKRMGIRTAAVATTSKDAMVTAYGFLAEDPALSFVVKAPISGIIEAAKWPDVGEAVADGTQLGTIGPQIAPADRASLTDRLATARADEDSARANIVSATAELNRLRRLNADDKGASDRAVEDAQNRLAGEQARLKGAADSIAALQTALAGAGAAFPMNVAKGGVVTEVTAHPGETVDLGQQVLRVTRFNSIFARVTVPAGVSIAGEPHATLVVIGHEKTPYEGERVGIAPQADPNLQGQTFVFRIHDAQASLRPGQSVTAYLENPGSRRAGVIVPRDAIVWHQGRSWAYVQTDDDSFARRPVDLEEPSGAGWFTRSLKAGDKVVTTGVQTLLSEEFKSQIQVEDTD